MGENTPASCAGTGTVVMSRNGKFFEFRVATSRRLFVMMLRSRSSAVVFKIGPLHGRAKIAVTFFDRAFARALAFEVRAIIESDDVRTKDSFRLIRAKKCHE